MSRRLYLFDDVRARAWAPFHLTRPVGELLHGCLLQRERWERVTGAECVGHLSGPALQGFQEEAGPPVVEGVDEEVDATRLVISSRAVPASLDSVTDLEGPATLVMAGEVVGWCLPSGTRLPAEDSLLDPSTAADLGETVELDGSLPGWPWDLIRTNAARLVDDITRLHGHGGAFLLTDVHLTGGHPISLGKNVRVEPGVIVDVREGPIRLEDRVQVEAPARLVGPLWVARDTRILGGAVGHSSIGPACRIRGEVSSCVFLGYANKAHDGFLGHAYVGRWVNLGAATTNSDLKNTYSAVRVPVSPTRIEDTGLLKVGCFLGDHVKTGIGTLINTGTVIGAGSNVFGGRMPPTWVPPFSWGSGEDLVAYRLDRFLDTAATSMGRRDVELDEAGRQLLTRAWEATRHERESERGRAGSRRDGSVGDGPGEGGDGP